jgi:ABC-type multidrug transport system fused ATPase/permease subunit
MSEPKMSLELELLVKGQENLTAQIGRLAEQNGNLADKITQLITLEAARAERESVQEKRNREFEEFIDSARDTIVRVKRFHSLLDGSLTKVFSVAIIAAVIYAASVIKTTGP